MGKTLFSKILGTNSGAALLQVMMVGTAIMTGSFYMTMQNNVTLKAVGGEYYSMELYIFEERLKEIFVDNRACREILIDSVPGGPNLGALGGSNPVNYNRLTSGRYGLLASSIAGDQGNFNVGANGMFIIPPGNPVGSSIRFRRARADTTPGIEEFGVLQVDFQINPAFRRSIIGPDTITKSIPLFVSFSGNVARDCFFDPGDTDRTDGNANGIVTQQIQAICRGNPLVAGEVAPIYDPLTGECFAPGLPLIADSPATFSNGGIPAPSEGNTLTNMRLQSVDTILSINGQLVNVGPRPRIVFDQDPSPVFLPNIFPAGGSPASARCSGNEVITGMQRVPDGSSIGYHYEWICSAVMTQADVDRVIDQGVIADNCANGFEVIQTPANSDNPWHINCTNSDVTTGVDPQGGGAAPLR